MASFLAKKRASSALRFSLRAGSMRTSSRAILSDRSTWFSNLILLNWSSEILLAFSAKAPSYSDTGPSFVFSPGRDRNRLKSVLFYGRKLECSRWAKSSLKSHQNYTMPKMRSLKALFLSLLPLKPYFLINRRRKHQSSRFLLIDFLLIVGDGNPILKCFSFEGSSKALKTFSLLFYWAGSGERNSPTRFGSLGIAERSIGGLSVAGGAELFFFICFGCII